MSSVGPGYDDSVVYGRTPSYQDRLGGQFYRDNWKRVIVAGRNIVVVETWNELHEATEICHSKEYGRYYINLTAELVEEFKEGFDYADASYVFINLGSGNTEQGLLQKGRTQPDGQTEVAVQNRIEGVQPDLNSTPIPSSYVYFDVNDRFIHAQETEVWIAVEYFDDQGSFAVEYDSADVSLPDEEIYKNTETVWLNGAEEWKIYIFHLSEAFFANRQNNFSDFRFGVCCERTQTFNRVWVSKFDPREMLSKIFPPSQIFPQSHPWTTDSIVGIDFEEPNYIASITEKPNADGETFPDMKADVECRRVPINSPAGIGNYLYLNVDDSIVFNDGPTELWIAVEYFDEGTDNLALQYDTVGEDAFKLAEFVPLVDTQEWKIHIYHIPDAEFKNQTNGADFRLSMEGMEFYINRVWVVGHEPTISELENFMLAERRRLADVSGNGTISAYDAALILQYVVGLIDHFPVEDMQAATQAIPTSYTISLPELSVQQGTRFQLPIMIQAFHEDNPLAPFSKGEAEQSEAVHEVTVERSEQSHPGVLAGAITLKYDAAVIKAVDVLAPKSINGIWRASIEHEGEVRLAFASSQPIENSGRMFIVEFDSSRQAIETPVVIDNVQIAEALGIKRVDGLITILPSKTVLMQNYPNPFNPETWIPYRLAADARVEITIYNSQGQLIRTFNLSNQVAGSYLTKDKAVYWDGRNDTGELVSSGIYFYHLRAGDFNATKRMIFLK